MGAPPAPGRQLSTRGTLGLGDAGPTGRLRLDALARLLQDVAGADSADSGIDPAWVVRRTTIRVPQWPVLGERLELTTFCSGFGPRWAERRTRVVGDRGACVEAVSLWVYVDAGGRPAPLPPEFHRIYGE